MALTTQNKEGNPFCSYNCQMTQDTQVTLALLQELVFTFSENKLILFKGFIAVFRALESLQSLN